MGYFSGRRFIKFSDNKNNPAEKKNGFQYIKGTEAVVSVLSSSGVEKLA